MLCVNAMFPVEVMLIHEQNKSWIKHIVLKPCIMPGNPHKCLWMRRLVTSLQACYNTAGLFILCHCTPRGFSASPKRFALSHYPSFHYRVHICGGTPRFKKNIGMEIYAVLSLRGSKVHTVCLQERVRHERHARLAGVYYFRGFLKKTVCVLYCLLSSKTPTMRPWI